MNRAIDFCKNVPKLQTELDADFQRFYGLDWNEELEKDAIKALSRASLLPPESSTMIKIESPTTWDIDKQLISVIILKLDQLIYSVGLTVDGKIAKKAESMHPMPTKPLQPEFYKKAIEEFEEDKKRQEHADLAADVLKRTAEIKEALSAPRVSSSNQEDIEDVTE